jgi:transcriptional regulator with XRE-family HTH domain
VCCARDRRAARSRTESNNATDSLEVVLTESGSASPLGDDVATSGVAALDELLGGLFWGDNVVWEVVGSTAADPFYAAAAAAVGYDGRVAIRMRESERVPAGFESIDARPGRQYAQPAPLLRAIGARCRRGDRNLLLFPGLEVMAEQWGATVVGAFFVRCCPWLLQLGAVAYWTLSGGGAYPRLRRTVEDVTQCVFSVGDDRVRIAKAEGRPPGVAGTVLRLRIEQGRPLLTPAPVAARIGTALRAARVTRHLSQSDLARLAGVSPSSISQAERGQSGLSLETLLKLAGKLNMTLDELLRGELAAGYRLGRLHQPPRRGASASSRPIALLDNPEVGLRAYLIRIPARATVEPHLTHKGIELVAVASGLVQVLLTTGRPVLRAGEVLLPEDVPITGWRNLSAGDATLFWILRDARRAEP